MLKILEKKVQNIELLNCNGGEATPPAIGGVAAHSGSAQPVGARIRENYLDRMPGDPSNPLLQSNEIVCSRT